MIPIHLRQLRQQPILKGDSLFSSVDSGEEHCFNVPRNRIVQYSHRTLITVNTF